MSASMTTLPILTGDEVRDVVGVVLRDVVALLTTVVPAEFGAVVADVAAVDGVPLRLLLDENAQEMSSSPV